MVKPDIAPTEIGKHLTLIKEAQAEIGTMDVLVCGHCWKVFHFIEEINQHKQKPCVREEPALLDSSDSKPVIWAFLLWKSTQPKNTANKVPNSWDFYQTWVKLEPNLRETWVVAGKTIQSFARVSQGGLQEMPVRITKTVVNNAPDSKKAVLQTKGQLTTPKSPVKAVNSPVVSQDNGRTVKKPLGNATTQNQNHQQNQNQSSPNEPNRAKRTTETSETEEAIDKIVAKRYNPRRKLHEYLCKWETRSYEENTWEPVTNLQHVSHLIDIFEKQLARQRENRLAAEAAAKKLQNAMVNGTTDPKQMPPTITNKPIKLPSMTAPDAPAAMGNLDLAQRPSRTSKTKAMDQVKQWMSNAANHHIPARNSPVQAPDESRVSSGSESIREWLNTSNTNASGALNTSAPNSKRKLASMDFDDHQMPTTTTSTIEDLEESLIPSHTVKRTKTGNSITVEVKTIHDKEVESKILRVNGTAPRKITVNGEPSTAAGQSADIIIATDGAATGVMRKPNIIRSRVNERQTGQKSEAKVRILSKGEAAVSSSGIVRLSGGAEVSSSRIPEVKANIATRPQQIRIGSGVIAERRTSGTTTQHQRPSNTTTITQRQVRTPAGTTIQRKIMSNAGGQTQQPQQQQQQRRTSQAAILRGTTTIQPTNQSQSHSGRMLMRQNNPAPKIPQTKVITPEQKILQLSKSGDLKVTKKVMTREDAAAQRLAQQQRQRQQQQHQQQSQVQIQKVQQIIPPPAVSSSSSGRNHADNTTVYMRQDEQQVCPITGKILVEHDEPHSSTQHLQSGVIQAHLVTDENQQQHLQMQQDQQQFQEIDANVLLNAAEQQLLTEDGSPLLVTGEDGTVYQVAGKNAEGQTVLVTEGPDGSQQYAYVAATTEAEETQQQVLTLDSAVAEAVAQLPADQQAEALAAASEGQYLVKTVQEDGTTQVVAMSEAELQQHQALLAQQQQMQVDGTQQLCIQTGGEADQEGNIPAEVVQADLPSPGGTRRVVLLLQDGTFMMTEMHDDEFKALNLTTG